MVRSPLNYTGSKLKILDQILPYFPRDKDITFIDLFCGGGSVFINSGFNKIIANDIINPLINFYKELQTKDSQEILKNIEAHKISKVNKKEYIEARNAFNAGGASNPYLFFSLLCSCTNNMIRFNKSFLFNQTFGERTFNESTKEKLLEFQKELKNKNIIFNNQSFESVPIPENSFVYIDPPYLITEAGYNAFWSKSNEELIYTYLTDLNTRNIKFMLSNVSEHKGVKNPNLDRLKDFNIVELTHEYNRVSRSGASKSKEIIVMNY